MQYVLGETISFNSCFPEPNALNNSVFEKVTFTKMACGGSYIVCLGADQKAYGMGENVKGQLGVNSIKFQFEFQPIMLPGLAKTVDVACGYQHTLFVSSTNYTT
jgi:alpha-tubulin suppressor-like RCC1 family protein